MVHEVAKKNTQWLRDVVNILKTNVTFNEIRNMSDLEKCAEIDRMHVIFV